MPSRSFTCRSHSVGYGRIAKRGLPAALPRRFSNRRDRHPRIDRDHAGLVGKHRIEIDLADLGKIRHELRELHQQELESMFVRRGNVAVGLEDARDPGARDQAARKREIERRQRQRLVADHFDRGAALPESDHRAEGGVICHADDQFARLGPDDHRKHRDAGDAGIGLRRARPRQDVRGRFTHRVLVTEIEPHAADFRFVDDVGRLNLERDRHALFEIRPRRRDRFVGIARQHRGRDRNLVS